MILGVLLALTAVAPVSAADPATVYNKYATSTNKTATYKNFTSAQKAALKDYLTATSVTRTPIKSTSIMAATYCTETGARIAAQNFLGVTLWAFELYVDYCVDGIRVLYPDMHTRGFVYMTGWSWQRTNSQSWFPANLIYHSRWKALGEAEFKFCIPLVNCIQYSYPWILATVYGGGGVNWQGGS